MGLGVARGRPTRALGLGSGVVASERTERIPHRVWTRTASLACLVEALALAGFVVFYGYEIAIGASDNVGRAVMSLLLFVVFGLGLVAMGRAWLRGLGWPRTPTIVWNLLLLPVAWGLRDGGRFGIALALGLVAALGIVAAALAGAPSRARGGSSAGR